MAQLALLLGYAFVLWLLRSDIKRRTLSSSALWIPALWFAIVGSRAPSFWLGGDTVGGSNLEGSPINSIINGALILGSIMVIRRRNFSWGQFIRQNKALVLIYSFFLASVAWSQIPLPTFKRLFNDMGNMLTPLVILTDRDPAAAIKTVYSRLAFLLLPMSVIAIRFFPAIGRQFDRSGVPMFTGVTGHKNSLGELAMVLSLVVIWDLLAAREREGGGLLAKSRWPSLIVLVFGMYLLVISSSATALGCFVLGLVFLLVAPRLERFSAAQLVIASSCLGLVGWVAEGVFGVSGVVYELLGRTSELTGRPQIWAAISKMEVNPLLGAGFRGFWEAQGEEIYRQLNTNRLLTAHNGYLEVYLNGGVVGSALLALLLFSTGILVLNRLTRRHPLGRIAIVFWMVSLLNNRTESVFFIGDPLWFTQLLFTIDWQSQGDPNAASVEIEKDKDVELANEPIASRLARARVGGGKLRQNRGSAQ